MEHRKIEPPEFTRDDVAACVRLLTAFAENRALMATLDAEQRRELLAAVGRMAHPERTELRRLTKALRRKDLQERRAHDAQIVEATALRNVRKAPVYVALPAPAAADAPAAPPPELPPETLASEEELLHPRRCYVCKVRYRKVHFFYDSMCPPCADYNYGKRTQMASLAGRVALITGARIKIGFQAACLMLRAGARVIVTTRFPRDAAARYAREPDFAAWGDRLQIHGLDLRHAPSVELFTQYLDETAGRLDLLVNNAAQTVRRPPAFYTHLLAAEERPFAELDGALQRILRPHEELTAALGAPPSIPSSAALAAAGGPGLMTWRDDARGIGLLAPARLSQLPCTPDDIEQAREIFPDGRVDADLQQVDLRRMNSWRMTASDVSTPELLEVHLVNAVAPFLLAARLKPLMQRDRTDEKHVVNVSAMEAQFSRGKKTDKHPHTNMAKAALNMLTRTSAADYAEAGIWMNSVDTGWVTDEDPMHHVHRKQRIHDFWPPLDIVDGAARICDPFFAGLLTGRHEWGKFYKDYRHTTW